MKIDLRGLSFLILIFTLLSTTPSFSEPEELCKQAGGKFVSFENSGANKCEYYVFTLGQITESDSIRNPVNDCDCGPKSCFFKNQCWIRAKGEAAWLNSIQSTIEFQLEYSSSKDAKLNESVTKTIETRRKEILACYEYDYKDKLQTPTELTVSFAINSHSLSGRLETSPNAQSIYPQANCINANMSKLNFTLLPEEYKFTYKFKYKPKL